MSQPNNDVYTVSTDPRLIESQPSSEVHYPTEGRVNKTSDETQWMQQPQGIPICPPGLEYLTMIDEIKIKQTSHLSAGCCNFESENTYDIKNSLDQTIYMAEEDTESCSRNCWGKLRPFTFHVRDYTGREVITFTRDLKCDCCCFPCCLQRMEIFSPPETLIGRVFQEFSLIRPQYRIEDAYGEKSFQISGPACIVPMCGDINFRVFTASNDEIGNIAKHWLGYAEIDTSSFSMKFPLDLDAKVKAALIGACILIHFNYFERELKDCQKNFQ